MMPAGRRDTGKRGTGWGTRYCAAEGIWKQACIVFYRADEQTPLLRRRDLPLPWSSLLENNLWRSGLFLTPRTERTVESLSSTGDSSVEGNLVSFNSDSSLGYSHLSISIFFSTVVSISSTVIGQIVSSKANSGSTEWSCFINTVVWEWNHVSKPWHSLVSTHISWHRRR